MRKVMTCAEVGELLDAYALGALEAEEANPIEAHISDCLRCWDALTEAQRVAALLALSAPLQRSNPALGRRLLERVAREARTGRRPLWLRLLPLTTALLLLLAVAALAWALVLQRQVDDLRAENRRLARFQEEALLVMLAADRQGAEMTGSGPWATVVARCYWSRADRLGLLLAYGLPEPPPGMAYQFWVYSDHRAVSGGVFKPRDGVVLRVVSIEAAWDTPSAFFITLEPDEGSPQPTGERVLTAQLAP